MTTNLDPAAVPVASTAGFGAVAGEFSWVMYRPGINRILEIESLIFIDVGGAGAAYSVRLITAAQIAAMAGTVGVRTGLLNLTGEIGSKLASEVMTGSQSGGITPGYGFFDTTAPPNGTIQINLPRHRRLRLSGADPNDRPGIVIYRTSVNLAASAGIVGYEK